MYYNNRIETESRDTPSPLHYTSVITSYTYISLRWLYSLTFTATKQKWPSPRCSCIEVAVVSRHYLLWSECIEFEVFGLRRDFQRSGVCVTNEGLINRGNYLLLMANARGRRRFSQLTHAHLQSNFISPHAPFYSIHVGRGEGVMMRFPSVSDPPYFRTLFQTPSKIFPNFTFSQKTSNFHPQKFLMMIFFSHWLEIWNSPNFAVSVYFPPLFRENYFSLLLQISPLIS